jgi:hypothetical protein
MSSATWTAVVPTSPPACRLPVDVNFAIDEQDSFEPKRVAGDDAVLDHELEQAGGTKRLDMILAIAHQQQLCAEIEACR